MTVLFGFMARVARVMNALALLGVVVSNYALFMLGMSLTWILGTVNWDCLAIICIELRVESLTFFFTATLLTIVIHGPGQAVTCVPS